MPSHSLPKWTQHHAGDLYAVILCRLKGNPEAGYGFAHTLATAMFRTRKDAQAAGFRLGESDDFNIGVFRKTRLVAILWMDEIVDDEPDVVAGIQHAMETGAWR